MVKVKICGITNLEDAQVAIEAGCDAVGFVFYKRSPRYIAPEKAASIIRRMPADILKVGVFVDAREKAIKRIAKLCALDMLQFHGSESPEFCKRFKAYRVMKAFRVKDKLDLTSILRYRPFAYLFDAYTQEKFGGTGRRFNWALIRRIEGLKRPVFLSGGLDAENIKAAINQAHPDWVDVSSSLEIKPGKKDHTKIKAFMQKLK